MTSAMEIHVAVLIVLALLSGTNGQQCSQITIRGEENGLYRGHFSATSSSTFQGLTLEFTFNNDVNSLEFSAGHVERIDNRRFRLLSPGWVAQPGWKIEFDFTPHFSGQKPIVTHVVMNRAEICSANVQAQQCSQISIRGEENGLYRGQFSATSSSTFQGLTLEFTFNNDVNSLEFSAGHVERMDNRRFRLLSPGWVAQPGWKIEFDFTPHFSGQRPIVTRVVMNGAEICGNQGNGDRPVTPPTTNHCPSTGMAPFDYSQALCMSYLFYEAQRSGRLPGDQRVTWRRDSAVNDGSDVNHDLSGGYYDAGDHVKFGFPMAFTATFLAWGLIEFPGGQNAAGQLQHGRAALKWATDYFFKAHTSAFELWGQVGDGDLDHSFWGRPEDMRMNRPAFRIHAGAPGSDLAGETAAALAAASIVFKDVDPNYSNRALSSAKTLYDFASQHHGEYHNAIPQAANFYRSWSGFGDELCWAALWLYRATRDSHYLSRARGHWDAYNLQYGEDSFNWDNKKGGIYALYAMLDSSDQLFRNTFSNYMDRMRTKPHTPGGLVYLQEWGTNRHACNVAFLGLVAAKMGINADTNRQWAERQINYVLGSNGRSFVVGFGNNPPQRPHHRSSSCPDIPQSCDGALQNPGPNPHVLYGALVGGPDQNDNYADVRTDYVRNEVACDYNAGFTAALGAMIENTWSRQG